MKNFEIKGKVIEITLDSGKVVKCATEWANRTIKALNTDMEDVLLMWLEDNDYLVNEEQDTLDKTAKGQSKITAKSEKKKTQKERVAKENPTKELIIKTIAEALENLDICDLNIENKAKIITFGYKNETFKVDLIQKRKPKA